MKEKVYYSNRTDDSVTIPTCDTCKFKNNNDFARSRSSSAIILCKAGLEYVYPEECEEFKANLQTRVSDYLQSL